MKLRRVVVVDDSPEDRAAVRRLLLPGAEGPYQLLEEETGAAAVRTVLADPPHCLLIDFRLPDMDAPAVLAEITGLDGFLPCPVVIMTGAVGEVLPRLALRAGAHGYIGKSWMTAESLGHVIEAAVEGYQMARELREQQAAAHDSEARLNLALEMSDTGLWTWDVKGDSVTWSPECYRILGLPEEGFAKTGDAFFQLVHPEDRGRVEAKVQAAVEKHALFECEFRVVRPEGEILWVANRGRALYDAGGEPVRMIGTVTDITERKRAEEELASRKLELQTLTDNTPDILARFDRGLRHVYVNAAVERATGRPVAEFLGRTNRELGMPEEMCALWDEALLSVFATGSPRSLEFVFPSLDGPQYYVAHLVPERGLSGQVEIVLSVTHDVTDRKRFEQNLAEQDRRKDEFLAILAHELRNPLASLHAGLAVLHLAPKPEVTARTLGMMDRQLSQLVHLVDDLLDVSRVSSGKITLRIERTTVQSLVEAAVESCRPHLVAKNHTLELDFPAEHLHVEGDTTRLVQVLSNLLTNAIKYTDHGGRIRVAVERQSQEAVLRMTDSGVGIAAEALPTLWGMFTQVGDTLDRSQGGLGIGLSLVKKLVEMHQGKVTAESPGRGRGSTFTVRLPLAPL